MDKSVFSIIGERYLDTQYNDEYIASLNAELQRKGVTGIYRWILEYTAASSLWWNLFWWEWCELNEKDIKIGWIQNVIFFGLSASVVAFFFGVYIGTWALIVLHILTTYLGFSLRSGTRINK